MGRQWNRSLPLLPVSSHLSPACPCPWVYNLTVTACHLPSCLLSPAPPSSNCLFYFVYAIYLQLEAFLHIIYYEPLPGFSPLPSLHGSSVCVYRSWVLQACLVGLNSTPSPFCPSPVVPLCLHTLPTVPSYCVIQYNITLLLYHVIAVGICFGRNTILPSRWLRGLLRCSSTHLVHGHIYLAACLQPLTTLLPVLIPSLQHTSPPDYSLFILPYIKEPSCCSDIWMPHTCCGPNV